MTPAPTIRPYQSPDREQVVELWRRCDLVRPWNDPYEDIERKLSHQPEMFLVAEVSGTLVASVMAGFEGHRGWINYLAVAPEQRGRETGRRLMEAAEALLAARGCPKINLQIRAGNSEVVDFYRRLGYSVDEVISMGKRL